MAKKKKHKSKITISDYIKAIKKADRETQMENQSGWVSVTRIHKSKKAYSRKNNKTDYSEE
ncbi:MAG: hypothetical protein ACLVKO_10075 [Dysgonomonas sp.]